MNEHWRTPHEEEKIWRSCEAAARKRGRFDEAVGYQSMADHAVSHGDMSLVDFIMLFAAHIERDLRIN